MSSDPPPAAVNPSPLTLKTRLQQAEDAIKAQDFSTAIQQLQIAVEKRGVHSASVIRLAELYVTVGEGEEAVESLTAWTKHSRTDVNVLLALSQTWTRLGQFQSATESIKPLLPEATSLPETARQWIAETLLSNGDTSRAESLLPHTSNNPEWLRLQGLFEKCKNRPENAAKFFEHAVALEPQNTNDLLLASLALRDSGKTERAIDLLRKTIGLRNPPVEAVYCLADLLARTGKSEEAAAVLKPLRGVEVNAAPYWRTMVLVEQARGNTIAAELARGYAAFHGGDPWGAESIWSALLVHASGDDLKETYAALHNSAYKREDAENALHWTEEALRHFPDDSYFLKRKAEVLLGQGQVPIAETTALKLQSIGPEGIQADAAELLCRIGLDGGKVDLLRKNAEKCRSLRPDDPDPLLHLAEWEEKSGDKQEALRNYQRAIKVDPQNADAFAHMGILQAQQQQTGDAEQSLLHALNLWSRVLEGTPHAELAQIYQRQHRLPEVRFHIKEYQRLRNIKERWPVLLKALRTGGSLTGWTELANVALVRRENWIARCAVQRALKIAPKDPRLWRLLAAVDKRDGLVTAALDNVLRAKRLETGAVVPKRK